ncbi:hypothetical protein DPMN_169009 [Dreissena polymorpha]|uniref:Uncharacterized protein n=1 Tax=Dreissena polymorpha TaxID=45954 RepID=A0A9D4F7N8_DREPO|nr:hypothetical protein DPMN_169009 [Dreissena polymorpha]
MIKIVLYILLLLLFQPELLSSIKSPKEIPKIVDAEWVGSDRPLFATVDGSLHMMDLTLKKASFSIEELELAGVCPCAVCSCAVCSCAVCSTLLGIGSGPFGLGKIALF